MHQNYVITPEQSRLRCYAKAIKEEIQYTYNDECRVRFPHHHPKILEYKGRILGDRSQVSDFVDWMEFLPKEYGPKASCLSLGSGSGRVESYLVRIGFAPRFETIELNTRENVTAMRADNRLDAREGDLNFVQLKPNTYDFILCHSVLHHLINIEHVLEQVNLALKPDGMLLVHEYVGEDRWQFSEARLRRLGEMFPDVRLKSTPVWMVDGFEAVRSGDLLALITALFGQVCDRSVNFGGVYFPLVTCNWSAARQKIERVVKLDEDVSRNEELAPCYHMGVYRKSSAAVPRAVPWTDEQLRARLFPVLSASEQFLRLWYGVKNVVRFRTRLRSSLSYLRLKGW